MSMSIAGASHLQHNRLGCHTASWRRATIPGHGPREAPSSVVSSVGGASRFGPNTTRLTTVATPPDGLWPSNFSDSARFGFGYIKKKTNTHVDLRLLLSVLRVCVRCPHFSAIASSSLTVPPSGPPAQMTCLSLRPRDLESKPCLGRTMRSHTYCCGANHGVNMVG